jgi:hypothetical protein
MSPPRESAALIKLRYRTRRYSRLNTVNCVYTLITTFTFDRTRRSFGNNIFEFRSTLCQPPVYSALFRDPACKFYGKYSPNLTQPPTALNSSGYEPNIGRPAYVCCVAEALLPMSEKRCSFPSCYPIPLWFKCQLAAVSRRCTPNSSAAPAMRIRHDMCVSDS